MLKVTFLVTALCGMLCAWSDEGGDKKPEATATSGKSVYDLTVKDIAGKDIPLVQYKSKVCLIVNVASL
ncbi:MAG: hypothetical protein AABZ12_09715 [Planctomycetota bacterium]